jgi:hypothetical protein
MADIPSDLIFDEAWYLTRYLDVAEALKGGSSLTALGHYLKFGRGEGRSGYRFDPDWYVLAYPPVNRDIAQGRASNPREHYERYGRYRGYLPHAGATRPESLAKQHPRFGGLWIDLPNSLDIVVGRRDAQLITAMEAALLSDFIENGFVVLRAAVASATIDRARHDLAIAYLGCYDTLLFDSPLHASGAAPWRPATNDGAAAALDIHCFSQAIRELIFSDEVISFLQLLFDSRPVVFASEGYLRGSGKHGQDAVLWPTTRPRHSAAVWFALERGQPCTGSHSFWAGSHRWDSLPINFGSIKQGETKRSDPAADTYTGPTGLPGAGTIKPLAHQHVRETTLSLDCGDAVIWHSGLWHGQQSVNSPPIMCRSVGAHYCPDYVAPASWESRPCQLLEHGNKGYYTADSR